ncbi:MAG: FG-GAP repeat protein, partial [Thermoplasmata archaeon]|nr:FG-GAP repeat protein [Thermoplasmata archaeon]
MKIKAYSIVGLLLLAAAVVMISSDPAAGSGYRMRTDLSQSSGSFIGEGETDWSGYSVSGAGDVDGDGYDDILIGAYYHDDGSYIIGKVYLIFGNASGGTKDFDLSNADASFVGKDASEYAGYSVSGVGDVNGDGYDDILFGSPLNSEGGTRAGKTHLILGKASGWARDTDISNADASFIGENAGDWSGTSVSGAGDVNGDGYDDIIIGAPENSDAGAVAGQTYLILGRSSGWEMDTYLSNANASFLGQNVMDYSGFSVSGAGDVNGDGYDDMLIGAIFNSYGGQESGQTYLIYGKGSGWAMDTTLNSVTASFTGENIEDYSGGSVSGAGDVNSDGYDDILIGSDYNDDGGEDAGKTYLILGRASGWGRNTPIESAKASFIGEHAGDRSGDSVSSAGDVNGDGYDDILIGASHNDDGDLGAGQTYLILGKRSGWEMDTDLSNADASFMGENKVAYSGTSVSSAGDVNRDGYDDILIGAFGGNDMGINSGKTYLLL